MYHHRPFIFNSDRALGDSVCAVAAAQQLAKLWAPHYGYCYLYAANQKVQDLMMTPELQLVDHLPEQGVRQVIHLNVGDFLQERGRRVHPIQHYMQQGGVEWPEAVPRPLFNLPKRPNYPVQRFDFLIAPFANETNRQWGTSPEEQAANWRALFRQLRVEVPGCSIGVIGGGAHQFRWWDYECISYVYDRPLAEVVLMMQCAGCVITVDSGPNRLAHGANISHHFLLSPTDVFPEVWITHPKAHQIYAKSSTRWSVDQILSVISESDLTALSL